MKDKIKISSTDKNRPTYFPAMPSFAYSTTNSNLKRTIYVKAIWSKHAVSFYGSYCSRLRTGQHRTGQQFVAHKKFLQQQAKKTFIAYRKIVITDQKILQQQTKSFYSRQKTFIADKKLLQQTKNFISDKKLLQQRRTFIAAGEHKSAVFGSCMPRYMCTQ